MIAALLFALVVLHSPIFSVGVVGFAIPIRSFFRNADNDASPAIPTSDEEDNLGPPFNSLCASLSSAANRRGKEGQKLGINSFMLSFFCRQRKTRSDDQVLAVPCNGSKSQHTDLQIQGARFLYSCQFQFAMREAAVVQRGELVLKFPAGNRHIPPWLFLVPDLHGPMVRAAFKRTIEEGEVYDATETIRQWSKQPFSPRAFDIWQPCVTNGITLCSGSEDPSQAWQLPFLAMYYRKREPDDVITYQDILFQFTEDPEQYQPRDRMVKAQRPMEIVIVNGEVSAAPEDTDDEVPDDQLRQEEDDGLLSTLWNISRSDSSNPARADSALMATYLMDRLNTTKQLENFTFFVIPCTHQVVISGALPAVRCRLKLPDWGWASEAVLVVGDGPNQSVNILDLERSGHVSAIMGVNYLVPLKHTTVNRTSVLEGDVLRIIRRWARSGRKTGRVLIEYSSTSEGPWQESGNGGGEKGEGVPFGSVFVFLKISKRAQQADPFRWRMDAIKRNEMGSGHQDTGNEPDNDTDVTDLGMREWSNASDVMTDVTATPVVTSLLAPEDACQRPGFPCPAPTSLTVRRTDQGTDHVREYLIELLKKGGNQTPQMWVIACSVMAAYLDGMVCNITLDGAPVRPKRVDLHLNFSLSPPDNTSSSLEVDVFHCDGITVTKVAILREAGAHVLSVTRVTDNWMDDAECIKGFFFRPICFDRSAMMVACEETVQFDNVPFIVVFPKDSSG
ncbi:PREDICTED: uncharacterized protein LOC109475186 [Branchiostoma belcheri]|uniref:Uncharacterized protein LOC109475186 n=1 Tax=Branchiostoma belcheri TaxID=7741 RepID=A0A6P4ZBR1_BRABE|nr:PREDICTED: uncharacterized protein LOC109475186 [Branchiostoma belcheri]